MGSHLIRASIRSLSFLLCLVSAALAAGPASTPETAAPVIVIGFVGGYVKYNDMVHSAVQVGAHLRHDYPSGVHVEVMENHHRQQAWTEILRLVDANRDGTLSAEEKRNARIILYGHSWGASEAITLARELEKDGIPVLLTVQVDSVAKRGQNDKDIPANVAEAANFYQPDGFLHGQPEIRAADPARTRIIGNFRFDYKTHPIRCDQYPWYDRFFVKTHTEIECDPKVWTQVQSLIQSHLPPQRPR